MSKICVYGDDLRMNYLKEYLANEKFEIVDIKQSNIIIGPIPFSKDGITLNISNDVISISALVKELESKGKILIAGSIQKEIQNILDEKNIVYYDVMKNNSLAIKNAIPTAEGAIAKAILSTNFVLKDANILVMGYGRVGKVLSHALKSMCDNIFVEARKDEDLSMIYSCGYTGVNLNNLDLFLPKMDIIFNTIPKLMLDEERLKKLKKDVLIIDLASKPGGVDYKTATKMKLKAYLELAIPTKVAPKSAAKYYFDEIKKIL